MFPIIRQNALETASYSASLLDTDAQQRIHGVYLTCYLHCSELHYSTVGVICEQICFSPAQQ